VRNSAAAVAGTMVCPTVSVGATLLNRSDSEDSLFRRVDEALYQSKIEGRDRTTMLLG